MDDLTDTRHISRLAIVDTGRRRRWSAAEKLRIVEESFSASRLASATARRHGISNQLLFAWRKAYREGRLGDIAGFVPAVIVAGVVWAVASSLFTVDVTEYGLVARFGRVVRVVAEPGLHVTAPFDRVVRLDKRVLFSRLPRSVGTSAWRPILSIRLAGVHRDICASDTRLAARCGAESRWAARHAIASTNICAARGPGHELREAVEALGWPLVWDQDEETAIRAPDGTGPFITWGPPIPAKIAKNRLHLDIAPPDHGDQRAEVDRLVSLGAARIDIGQGDVDWVVMADPGGNEFCVLSPR